MGCARCLDEVMARSCCCPVCNVACLAGLRDSLLERRMQKLEARCDRCEWHGSWQDREGHMLTCELALAEAVWRCPVEACPFKAPTERLVEIHMLTGLHEHADLLQPAPHRHMSVGGKDYAEVYIPVLSTFYACGNSLCSPVFIAANGYMCILKATPMFNGVRCDLCFLPSRSYSGATFPFQRPFYFLVVDPDNQYRVSENYIDFHM